jgi:hypothetical protein
MKVLVQPPSTDGRGEIDKSVSEVVVGPTKGAKFKTKKMGMTAMPYNYIYIERESIEHRARERLVMVLCIASIRSLPSHI